MADDFKALLEEQKKTTRQLMSVEERAAEDAADQERREVRSEAARRGWETRQENTTQKQTEAIDTGTTESKSYFTSLAQNMGGKLSTLIKSTKEVTGAAATEAKEKAKAAAKKTLSVLQSIATGITGMAKKAKAAIMGKLPPLSTLLMLGVGGAILAMMNSPAMQKLKDFLLDKVIPVIADLYDNVIKPGFNAILGFFQNELWPTLTKFMEETVVPIIKDLYNGIIKPAFDAIVGFFKESIWPAIKDFFAGDDGPSGIKKLYVNVIKPAFTAIGDFFKSDVFPAIKEIATKLGDLWDTLKPKLTALGDFLIETTFPVLFDTIKTNFVIVKNIFMKMIDFVKNLVSGDFSAAFDNLKDIGKKIVKAVDNAITGVLKAVGLDFEGSVGDVIGRFFTDIIKKITDTFNDTIKGIMTFIENSIRDIPLIGDEVADKIFGEKKEEAMPAHLGGGGIVADIAKEAEAERKRAAKEERDRLRTNRQKMILGRKIRQATELEKDVAEDAWHEFEPERKRDKKQLELLRAEIAQMKAAQAAAGVSIVNAPTSSVVNAPKSTTVATTSMVPGPMVYHIAVAR